MEEIDPKQFEAAQSLFKKTCDFLMGAVKVSQFPETTLPEIAFAGRSNVGKSSLINAVLNRRNLARTSKTPGRTQEVNFFTLADKMMIVDLPGYGYAKVSRDKTEVWNETIRLYLKGRVPLKRVFLLIDSRHGLKATDIQIMEMLDEAAMSYQIVLTKIDKIKASDLEKVKQSIEATFPKHPAAYPEVLATSSEKKRGLEELHYAAFRLL